MSWDARQQRMLQAMGLRIWSAPAPVPAVPAAALARAPQGPATDSAARPAATARLAPAATGQTAPAAAVAASLPRLAELPTLAGMGWEDLQSHASSCRACGLCESRQRVVFGVGHLQAHCLIVGEAPGAEEDARGEPFVGASGQLLDAMLAALDMSRSSEGPGAQRVYIANTLKCRPPANRNPQPQELQRCAPYLQRQLALLQPRVVMALGRFAAQLLLGTDEPLGKLRGQVHRSAFAGDRPVVVSYHPSYLLRSPGEKAKAWADWCLLAEHLQAR